MATKGAVALTDKTWAAILEQIAGGKSVLQVCRDPDMPNASAVYYRLDQDPQAADEYARAAASRALSYSDRLSDIVDGVLDGSISVDAGRMAADTYKCISARLQPRLYGDRQTVDVSVQHTHTLHLEALQRLVARGSAPIDAEFTEVKPKRIRKAKKATT